jgi:hypothetical protein
VFLPAINAGEDTTLCAWVSSVPINGTVSNARNFGWGTDGDGHFTDPYAINTHYIPGTNDKTSGSVNLILVAFARPPCSGKIIDTKQLFIDPCTSVQEPSKNELRMEINPNPAESIASLTVYGLRENALVTLTGMDGATLASFMLEPTGQQIAKQLDISGFSKGIYILHLRSSDKILTEKIIIR